MLNKLYILSALLLVPLVGFLAPDKALAYTILSKRVADPPVTQAVVQEQKLEHQGKAVNTQSLSTLYKQRALYYEGTSELPPTLPQGTIRRPEESVPSTRSEIIEDPKRRELPPAPAVLAASLRAPMGLSSVRHLTNSGPEVGLVSLGSLGLSFIAQRKSLRLLRGFWMG